MIESEQDEINAIMEYISSTNLKGRVEIGDNDSFWWHLGGVSLSFHIGSGETTIEYGRYNWKHFPIGHLHVDNSDLIQMIKEIDSESKMVEISSALPLGSSFAIIDKTRKKKKSWLLIRRYYSC